ncbi:Uncharacterized protein ALO39_05539 [Pseudomonas syringae pv. lapsa]|nr:Uncharacterized protein ALO39_05539 [Pseudomonas syringae pv. lapsa]
MLESHHFPSVFLLDQRAQQTVVQCMPRFETPELTNQAVAQQVEVTDGVEDFVFDEFVLVPQAVFVQYTVLVDHDGVFHAAAECEVVLAQVLDITHEPEGPGTADFLHEGSAGKVHACTLGAVTEDGVIEIDLETDLEPFERHEGSAFTALLHCDFTQDTDEFLRLVLFFQACRLNQEYERACAAVHDRNFGGRELDVGVIDAKASHGREQVFYRVDFDITIDQSGRQSGVTDVFRTRRDLHDGIKVSSAKHNAGIHRCGLEGQVNLLPGVQAYTCGTDNIFQGALFYHGMGRFSASCELVSTKAGDDSRPCLC